MTVFVIQDTDGRYLNREAQWNDAESTVAVFYSPHKDIALNQLLEVNAQDVLLRAQVVACPSNPKGRPVITVAAAVNNTASAEAQSAVEAETGTAINAEEQDPEEINDANAA
ncbi:MAG: hypothetical protein KBT63_07160 [Porticoccaceae bacterium]|nr:hypothetical protein [Porticoccaceae bacterium]